MRLTFLAICFAVSIWIASTANTGQLVATDIDDDMWLASFMVFSQTYDHEWSRRVWDYAVLVGSLFERGLWSCVCWEGGEQIMEQVCTKHAPEIICKVISR